MRFQRFGTFVGGLDLPEEKSATCDRAILPIPRPMRLSVPLDPCRLGNVQPLVAVGDRVAADQRIAVAGEDMPIFTPLAGTVQGFGRCTLASCSPQGIDCPSLELVDLSDVRDFPRPPAETPWDNLDPEEAISRIASGGLTTMAEPLEPLAQWILRARRAKVDTLIANGMENQPYLTGSHRMMAECGGEIVEALALVGRLMGAENVALAVDHRRTGDYRGMERPARRRGVQLLALVHKYPTGHSTILTLLLARREVPIGGTPMDVRVAVIEPAACLALYRWLTYAEPCTHRIVTVCGEGVGMPGNYWVPLGVSTAHVLAECDTPVGGNLLCCGGPMTGHALPAASIVSPGTGALLALPQEDAQPASACIRCGWCTDHCPARLNVAFLNDLYELGQVPRAMRRGVRACLGCGVCSYVCPARLPLRHRMIQLAKAAGDIVRQRDSRPSEAVAAT